MRNCARVVRNVAAPPTMSPTSVEDTVNHASIAVTPSLWPLPATGGLIIVPGYESPFQDLEPSRPAEQPKSLGRDHPNGARHNVGDQKGLRAEYPPHRSWNQNRP